jgi:molybdopterin synthase sulfur carrier subunit
MKISVKLYATLTKYAGGSIMHEAMEVEIPEGATFQELYDQLGIPPDEVKIAFVNSTIQEPDYKFREGDEVGIFPPVGGG